MSFYEEHVVQVVCDGSGCYSDATKGDTESQATKHAREEGFVEIGGKWYCEDCAKKANRRRKP